MRIIFVLLIFSTILNAQYYIAPNVDDDNSGSITSPFETIKKSI